jgi:hypothetical protein
MGCDAQVKKIIVDYDEKSGRMTVGYEGDVSVWEAIAMLSMADHIVKTESWVVGDNDEEGQSKGWLMS